MVELTDQEQRWLHGDHGQAMQLAMRLIVTAAEIDGAAELVEVDFAHINSCHWSGRMSEDFAEFLLAEGGRLSVPTFTNASLIDCARPELRPEVQTPAAVRGARRVMEIYEQLGCEPIWTCAPYHDAAARPSLGQHVIGSESNAVSFYNSALGARTNKYGDLFDIAGAMVGRVPLSGLHLDAGRAASLHVQLDDFADDAFDDPSTFHALGIWLGETVATSIAAVDGLPRASETDLKAIAAAGATSGSVALFHLIGITPEAATFDDAFRGGTPDRAFVVRPDDLRTVAGRLSTGDGPLNAICLGTPHFSVDEFGDLVRLLDDRRISPSVEVLVTTSRAVSHEIGLRGWGDRLEAAGVQVVLDTCTYYTPRPTGVEGLVMTNSAKWAYYAPGILDVDVAFANLADCVESAVAGEVVRS
ncbi:MAG: aconitase X catalytic domain-containing protein [Actinomycetota bacterium]